MKTLRIVLALVFGLICLSSFIQGFFLRFTLVLPFIAMSLLGMWLCLRWEDFALFWKNLRKRIWGKIITSTLILLIAVAITVCAVISGLMINAMVQRTPDGDATVIVLGAQVVGERPSLILRLRLEAALIYLNDNPESSAILSGGLGRSAYISEAEAMKRWLAANGICESRLFLEEYSTSTYENIAFSRFIIEENGLPRNVAIATDGFHMFRAHQLARHAELTPSAVPSRTPLRVLPYYWLREIAAILVGIAMH